MQVKSKINFHGIPEAPKKPAKKAVFGRLREKSIDKSSEIALYYGFSPCEPPEITREDIAKSKALLGGEYLKDKEDAFLSVFPEEKTAVLRHYAEKGMASLPQPVMIRWGKPITPQHGKKPESREKFIGLEILGTEKSVAEAIIIQSSFLMLKEEGYKNIYIALNSVGDKESVGKFSKELGNYCRQNFDLLAPRSREAVKKDSWALLKSSEEDCLSLRGSAPNPMAYLSDKSRGHFKEVLEYMEMLNIPYRIESNLIGKKYFCSETVFEIREAGETGKDLVLGCGCRYDGMAKRLGWRKDLPGVGLSLFFKKIAKDSEKVKPIRLPKIYFIHLGFEAKLRSLEVIEILRKAEIPVYQSLSKDKMAVQVAMAESMNVPYVIIMGQKEAMEESVIVRNMETRSQESVKIADLPAHLKKI